MPDPDFPTAYDAIDAGVITPSPEIAILLIVLLLAGVWIAVWQSK
ncbi:hypothetical protein ACQ4M3_07700 [Leptolyngbya sp. AN03gr2]